MSTRMRFYITDDTRRFVEQRGVQTSEVVNLALARYATMLTESLPVLPTDAWDAILCALLDKPGINPTIARKVMYASLNEQFPEIASCVLRSWTESMVIAVVDLAERFSAARPFRSMIDFIPEEKIK